jgi:hypothetical protein
MNATKNPISDSEFTQEFFNEASRAWMENKVKVGYQILYRCTFTHVNQQRCKRVCSSSSSEYCLNHKRVGKKREVKAEKKAVKKAAKAGHGYNLRSRNAKK